MTSTLYAAERPERGLVGDCDLAADVAAATFGVSIDADETARAALDNLSWHGI